jgi:hypothetical protein
MIGICKHERATLARDIGLVVIIAKINWSCKGVASTNPKLLALTSSNLIMPYGSHFIAYFKRYYDQYEDVIPWMFMCAPHNINVVQW